MEVSQKAFAEVLIQALRYFGEARPIYLDEKSFKLTVPGDDHGFWIGNLFTEFLTGGSEECDKFLTSVWEIWSHVQADLPAVPDWIPEMIRPFRDETHPLSYRVERIPDARLWTVVSPFDEQIEKREYERFDLVDAYYVWWDHQFQRACKKHLRNIYHWLTFGQVTEDELRLLSELRRIWRQGRLSPQREDFQLAGELTWLGATSELPPKLSELLHTISEHFGAVESSLRALRQMRSEGCQ